eukprot:768104-Hanusia_phi.AAC.9
MLFTGHVLACAWYFVGQLDRKNGCVGWEVEKDERRSRSRERRRKTITPRRKPRRRCLIELQVGVKAHKEG